MAHIVKLGVFVFLSTGICFAQTASVEDGVILTGDAFGIRSIAVSPDGKHFVTAHGIHASLGARGHIVIWETKSLKKVATVSGLGPIDTVVFSPDGKTIAAVGSSMAFIDFASKKPLRSISPTGFSPGYVLAVAFSADGKSLATCHKGNPTVYIWDSKTGKLQEQLKRHNRTVVSICFSCDGKTLATSSADEGQSITLWSAQTWKPLKSLPTTGDGAIVRFSPKDPEVLFISFNGPFLRKPSIWNVENVKEEVILKEVFGGLVRDAVFSDDGKYVFIADSEQLTGWDVKTGKRHGRVGSEYLKASNGIDAVAFLPIDKSVVYGDRQMDGQAKIVIISIDDFLRK